MKTKERILHTSLALFNEYGEPNVTTLQIADELDISPGNLYYHFKNKTEILNELFGWYEHQLHELLDPVEGPSSVEDQWLFLHLIFEAIAQYRFLYQDTVNLLSRYKHISGRFRRILEKKRKACLALLNSLQLAGILEANDKEKESITENMVMTMTFWISYAIVSSEKDHDIELNKGVFQIMSSISPYITQEDREMLVEMGNAYL